jgi:hypothetical protein
LETGTTDLRAACLALRRDGLAEAERLAFLWRGGAGTQRAGAGALGNMSSADLKGAGWASAGSMRPRGHCAAVARRGPFAGDRHTWQGVCSAHHSRDGRARAGSRLPRGLPQQWVLLLLRREAASWRPSPQGSSEDRESILQAEPAFAALAAAWLRHLAAPAAAHAPEHVARLEHG